MLTATEAAPNGLKAQYAHTARGGLPMENGAHQAPGMVGIAWFVPNFPNLGAKLLRVVLCGFTMSHPLVRKLRQKGNSPVAYGSSE